MPTIDSTPGSSGGRPETVTPKRTSLRPLYRREQKGPGTLDQGAQREPMRSPDRLELGRHIRRKRGLTLGDGLRRDAALRLRRGASSPSGVAAVTLSGPAASNPSAVCRPDRAARRRNRETAGSVSIAGSFPPRIDS